jgi:hypothetical protein
MPHDYTGKTIQIRLLELNRESNFAFNVFKRVYGLSRSVSALATDNPVEMSWRILYERGPSLCDSMLLVVDGIYEAMKIAREGMKNEEVNPSVEA